MPDEFPAVRFRMRRDRLLEPWKERLPDEHSTSSSVPILIYKLPQGGEFRIIKGFLNEEGQSSLERELLEDHRRLFRQYFVQGQKEPRIHFLLHENGHDPNASSATEVESKRIGYRYGRVIMLAKPLKNLPFLAKLSNDLAAICQLTSWNIGVNPVLYRDTNDCINLHSDNDQGETTILTLIVSVPDNSSSTRRPVLIRSRPNIKAGSNNRSKRSTDTEEEQYEITLNPGDAYVMDESMQKNYVHGVGRAAPPPPGKSSRELVVVFRNGRQENFAKDSGISVPDLTPPKQSSYHFGEMEDLVLGETSPRTLLCAFKFHR
jgi:alkylated DNA repair dioxygenase AlkB